MHLLDYVKALENKDNWARGQQILADLKALGIRPTVQECPRLKIRNIIVDFSPDTEAKRLLFSAHYDSVKHSPGANDNASGVAVLLGLCRRLRHTITPLRIIFFDREEAWLRTPIIRLGLLGSMYYILRSNLRNVAMVYNLEFCGMGDFLAIWPTKNNHTAKEVEQAAAQLSLPFELAHIPGLFLTSDHLSFRLRGVPALSLSLIPISQVAILKRFLDGLSIPKLLIGQRPPLPEPLCYIHTSKDTSSRLNENSLGLMLSLLLEIIVMTMGIQR